MKGFFYDTPSPVAPSIKSHNITSLFYLNILGFLQKK